MDLQTAVYIHTICFYIHILVYTAGVEYNLIGPIYLETACTREIYKLRSELKTRVLVLYTCSTGRIVIIVEVKLCSIYRMFKEEKKICHRFHISVSDVGISIHPIFNPNKLTFVPTSKVYTCLANFLRRIQFDFLILNCIFSAYAFVL